MRKLYTISRLSAAFFVVLTVGCSQLPQRAGVAVEQRPSPNYDQRRPNFVILHYTSNNTAARALRTLTDPVRRVSSHYLIGREGKIYYLVDELARAWHAGESYWGGNRDLNSISIGIELDNDGDEPYADTQIEALLALLADLKRRYAIPRANILGHSDVAPTRKVDPGRHFPWRRLAARGYGLWCERPDLVAATTADGAMLLAALGYDITDYAAAVAAFKLHYAPDGDMRELTDGDRALLQCLIVEKHRQ